MRLIAGLNPVREAIRVHGDKLARVLVETRGGPQIEAVARFAVDHGAKVEHVTRADLDRACKGARHQGAIAYAPDLVLGSLDDLIAKLDDKALIVALDELEDPQNFGAIVRSAVALGATAILWPEHHAAPLSPATFRASAGAIEHAALYRVKSLHVALNQLHEAGAFVVGLDANADDALSAAAVDAAKGPVVLVIGAEGKGLRKPVKRACTCLVRLPMSGRLDSLNASVAAGIAIYEIMRHRHVYSAK
ncbi:MAG: 23S rRNA (guanosine(2251)-2'-O)-methyltransferase RlmB [Polyangiaceae bacterium]|nr:23S rRNA (guanosine(2251)-2'-O)-methyltransferase RlmB [Polyangiaceae bacterium]